MRTGVDTTKGHPKLQCSFDFDFVGITEDECMAIPFGGGASGHGSCSSV